MMANIDFVNKVPQVSPEGLRIPTISFDTGAGQVASALAGLGDTVSAAGFELQDRYDTSEAQNKLNELYHRRRELLRGRSVSSTAASGADGSDAASPLAAVGSLDALGDASSSIPGYFTLKGNNATAARAEYEDIFKRDIEEVLSGSSGRVRAKLEVAANNLSREGLDSIAAHAAAQQAVFEDDVHKASMLEAGQEAVDNSMYTAAVLISIDDVYQGTYDYEIRMGSGDAAARSAAEEATTIVHINVIKDLLNRGRPDKAKEYYEAITANARYGPGFDATARGEILKLITVDEAVTVAQNNVDSLAAAHTLTTSDGAKSALAKARSLYRGTERADTVKLLKARIAEATAIQATADKERFDSLTTEAATGVFVKPSEMMGLSEREKSYLATVTLHAQMKLADPNYRRSGDGGATWKKFMIDSSDEKSFAALSAHELALTYEDGVTDDRWENSILPWWRAAKLAVAEDAKSDADAARIASNDAGTMTNIRRVKSLMFTLGLKPEDEDLFARIDAEIDRRVGNSGDASETNKRMITNDLAKEYLIYDQSDTWLSSDAMEFAFNMTSAQKLTMAKDLDIPAQDRESFRDSFDTMVDLIRSKNLRVTRGRILTLWNSRSQ